VAKREFVSNEMIPTKDEVISQAEILEKSGPSPGVFNLA
jgi:hypothetical protein